MLLKHSTHTINVGDGLSPLIYTYMTGQPAPENVTYENPHALPNLMIVGSVLQFADPKTVVWGAGLMADRECFGVRSWDEYHSQSGISAKPAQICAVRGPLTRAALHTFGIDAPAVYGDPGLLMPRFFAPAVRTAHRLGIVWHFRDAPNAPAIYGRGVRTISILDDPKAYITTMLSCEMIVSSSLHALVLADAYGIPSLWVELDDTAGQFKFHDYYRSIGITDIRPFMVGPDTTAAKLLACKRTRPMHIDLEALLDAWPLARVSVPPD